MKIATLIALSSLNVFFLTGAQAGDAAQARNAKVSYADLNLSSTAGNAALYQRVKTAANRVCEGFEATSKLSRFILGPQYEECVNGALQDAVSKVNVATFSAYVASKNGGITLARLASK